MIVYRVERRTGEAGPYCIAGSVGLTAAEEALRLEAIQDHADDDHPEPEEDGLGAMAANEYCCFTSLEALCEWFCEGGLDLLYHAGFGVFPFEVDEAFVRVGERQAVFVRSEAVRRAELEPLSA